MDTTRVQQKALDDELVASANHLKIGKSNLRLSLILKSKEPTLQVALDALKLTLFYNTFEISADVPEIYMQEFWVTVSRHHSSLCFKLNGKSLHVTLDYFKRIGSRFALNSQVMEVNHTVKVPDEQQHTISSTNKGASDKPEDEEENDEHDSANDNDDQENDNGETKSDDDGDNFVHLNLSTYKEDDQDKEKEEEKANDDDEVSSDQEDAEMTDAQSNQETEEVHVTLTIEPPVVQQQSSSVSSDLVSKFNNPSPDIGIVDTYLVSKMKEAVDVDSTRKTIIKDQVKAQVSKIMPKIEKYVTESLGAEVIVRSTNQPQTTYAVEASLSEFELKKILINKMEANKSINRSDNQNNLYNALVKSYNSDKDIIMVDCFLFEQIRIIDITRAQQKDLDDDLVTPANRLKNGKCNLILRLTSDLNSKEPTLNVTKTLLNSLPSTKHLRSLLMYQKSTCKNSRSLPPDITLYFVSR
ncbi:hypothetical protein Tco_0832857 [Tanacetum coccineum]